MTITEIRIKWATIREAMCTTCAQINQLEDELASARSVKRNLQRELTELEVREKELLGEVKYCGPAKVTKVKKAISACVKESFSHLTQGEKEELVKSLLGDLLK